MLNSVMTIREVMNKFNISRPGLVERILSGKIKGEKRDGIWLVSRRSAEFYFSTTAGQVNSKRAALK